MTFLKLDKKKSEKNVANIFLLRLPNTWLQYDYIVIVFLLNKKNYVKRQCLGQSKHVWAFNLPKFKYNQSFFSFSKISSISKGSRIFLISPPRAQWPHYFWIFFQCLVFFNGKVTKKRTFFAASLSQPTNIYRTFQSKKGKLS